MTFQKQKKDKSLHIRLPDKLKVAVDEEARKNYRTFQEETLVLLSQALHQRKYDIKDWA
jgi:predicted DNA binding CopG/RHH family protein